MQYKTFQSVLSADAIKILCEFYRKHDEFLDQRPDVSSKKLRWDLDDFPQDILQTALDVILPDDYEVEVVHFFDSKISFRLHTDGGDTANDPIYRNVILPIWIDGPATTVLFDNHYNGPSTRFAQSNADPFRYNLQNVKGDFVWVDDIRDLLYQCKTAPNEVNDFHVDADFIRSLESLIEKRGQDADRRTSDYSAVTNYRPNRPIDRAMYDRYLRHMPLEDLQGLTVEYIYDWQVGGALTFPRTQLHCAGFGHNRKIGVSIFTRYKKLDFSNQ